VSKWQKDGADFATAFHLARHGMVPIVGGVSTNFINDMANTLVFPSGAQTIVPQSLGAGTLNGAALDVNDSDGPVFMMAFIGALTGTIDIKAQESTVSGSGFADFSPSIAFAQQNAANKTLILNYKRTKQFQRAVATVGTGPVLGAVAIFGLKKAQ
jgi:hypothetical protein